MRVAFDRPEVRNAFRPSTVDEMYTALDHARQLSDVGCVLITGNGPSPKDGGWAFCSGGDQRIRGRDGYRYAEGDDRRDDRPGSSRPAAHPRGAAADPVHAEGGHRGRARLGRRWRAQPARGLRPDDRQSPARAVQADRREGWQLRRRLRLGVPRPSGRAEVRPGDLLPRQGVRRGGGPSDGHGQRRSSTMPTSSRRRSSGRAESTR